MAHASQSKSEIVGEILEYTRPHVSRDDAAAAQAHAGALDEQPLHAATTAYCENRCKSRPCFWSVVVQRLSGPLGPTPPSSRLFVLVLVVSFLPPRTEKPSGILSHACWPWFQTGLFLDLVARVDDGKPSPLVVHIWSRFEIDGC